MKAFFKFQLNYRMRKTNNAHSSRGCRCSCSLSTSLSSECTWSSSALAEEMQRKANAFSRQQEDTGADTAHAYPGCIPAGGTQARLTHNVLPNYFQCKTGSASLPRPGTTSARSALQECTALAPTTSLARAWVQLLNRSTVLQHGLQSGWNLHSLNHSILYLLC